MMKQENNKGRETPILAVSTSWAAGLGLKPDYLLEVLEDLPVQGIELDYRLDTDCFGALAAMLKTSRLVVTSVHNFCPCPAIIKGLPPSGDYFNLADLDKEKRHLAVQWTLRTMEHACDAEAPCVVLHCGKVPEQEQDRRFKRKLASAGPDIDKELKPELDCRLKERRLLAPASLDALLFSLDRLLAPAEKMGLTLGIENRYYWNELPGFDELGRILDTFRGAPLGYWHDMGHARAQELLELVGPGKLLETYGEHLVGIHVHDARGLRDHLPPGSGQLDFAALKPYLESGPALVLELAPTTACESVRQGIDYLRQSLDLPFEPPGDDFGLDSKEIFI